MTDDTTLVTDISSDNSRRQGSGPEVLALVVIWSLDEGDRVGEVLLVPGGKPGPTRIFGRGAAGADRIELVRQRPGRMDPTGPTRSRRISREQLSIQAVGRTSLYINNVGRRQMYLNGREAVDNAEVRPGDVIELANELSFLCTRRLVHMPPVAEGISLPLHPYGTADDFGMVGESPALWALRQQVAFVAGRNTHVLITGSSGTGKELAARAIHALSSRGTRAMVSRNAATLPEGLIDAELFGNVRGYPNPGMRERPGLIGESDQSTLFLDEVGELPIELQSHLLRVLDEGEYQRLGEARSRNSDFRLVAATNRDETALKHDLFARLRVRMALPDLNTRREDVPLITRHLLRNIAREDSTIAARYFPEADPRAEPRVSPELVRALIQHEYTTHVRELEALLWQGMASSPGKIIEYGPEMKLTRPEPADVIDPTELSREIIAACLEKHNGVQAHVWRDLGLRNRHVLARLIKKHGLVAGERELDEDDELTEHGD